MMTNEHVSHGEGKVSTNQVERSCCIMVEKFAKT